jgi:hypothetical protein
MARANITDAPESLIDDSGTVLWSFIRGEQLEFPVVVNFLTDCTTDSGYVFNAVVLEAENIIGQTTAPVTLQVGGIRTTLNLRQLVFDGAWNAATAYNAGECVSYNAKYYYLLAGTARVSATVPTSDPLWIETTLNTLFVQFPNTLGADWAVKPKINTATYGFFELSVQEPATYSFRRMWKPVRGMVQLLYSPTQFPVDP